MEKFSVKKPFTILVAVIMVLLLGFVSITNMQTNLLPDISTPYLMVVTVYPGASPERVESEVSDVMENALGTVSGVESITATSAENYSLLLMKFAEGTDMNSAMVKVAMLRMPLMMTGAASGSSMRYSSWRSVEPMPRAASMMAGSMARE